MLVFIDESGDAGFKIGRGSSHHFVVSCVIFNDKEDVRRINQLMENIRKEMRLNEDYEFRFSESSKRVKDGFFDRIRDGKFKYRGILITKGDIFSRELIESTDNFHRFVVKEMLKYNRDLKDADIYIDKLGDKTFKKEWKRYLLREVNEDKKCKKIKSVNFRNSRTNNPIQLADMISGAVRRSFVDEPGSVIYRDLIKDKEIEIWDYCKIYRDKGRRG